MISVKDLKKFGQIQFKKFIAGGRLPTAMSLVSMTLDKDDEILAKRLICDPAKWNERRIIEDYEREFARWNGSRYAFAFMGGRVALSACIHAIGLKPGDEVILPGYTCVVVPNAFQYQGIKTVFCDIELDTYGLDVQKIKERITDRTRAILLHHLYGLVSRDYDEILALAKKYNLRVIEDCAHVTGAKYHGVNVGNRGDVAFYSSELSKVFNTIQGGIAITNDLSIAEKLKEYYDQAPYPDKERVEKILYNVILQYSETKSSHYFKRDWIHIKYGDKRIVSTTPEEEEGRQPGYYGQKMPAPIAALGLNQLRKIDTYNYRRRLMAMKWDEWCDRNNYRKPLVIPGSTPVYLRYPVLVEAARKRNTDWARKQFNVELGVWFVSHIHPTQRVVRGCPQADRAVECCINFPCLMEGA
jgi:dTDP-4-amino-4,6-dideoxygalactose transaminase